MDVKKKLISPSLVVLLLCLLAARFGKESFWWLSPLAVILFFVFVRRAKTGTKKKLILLFLVVLSLSLLVISFDRESFSWLSLFALVPFFALISRVKNKKMAFLTGWFVGLVFFLFNLEWFLGPNYVWWSGGENFIFSMFVFSFAWFGSALVLGLSFGVFALVFFFCEKTLVFQAGFEREASMVRAKRESKARNPERDTLGRARKARNTRGFVVNIIFLSSVWVLLEYLRSWLFCFWGWGAESIFGPYWTFGHLGYTLVNSPASVLARCVGLYGLSFLVVFVNLLIFQKRAWTLLVVFLFIFVLVPFVSKDYSSGKSIRADVFHAESPDIYYDTVIDLLRDNPLPDNYSRLPRVVVFPEGSDFFSTETLDAKNLLPYLFREESGLIVSSTALEQENHKYEYIIYVNKNGSILEKQKKSFLISSGEYMPYVAYYFLKLFSFEKQISVFESRRHFNRGSESEKIFSSQDIGAKIGSLACSGILSPVFYRKLAKDGAEILVNSASHQSFGYSGRGLFHLMTFARFQAIANARPFLQSVFGGYAFILDADGNFVDIDSARGNYFVSGEIQTANKKTLYTRLGDWFLWLAVGFVLFGVYFRMKYNRMEQ